jgi:hypothetical protein
MANTDGRNFISITPEELQNLLRSAIKEAVASATALNPLEQRKLDEELAKDHRRSAMILQLGKIEAEAQLQKRNACSHMRDAKTGDAVPRNWPTGEWTTGGQAYQNGLAVIICQRCSTTWMFKPEPNYYNAILQNGLLKAAPPPEEYTICPGCFELKPACKCLEIYVQAKQALAAA